MDDEQQPGPAGSRWWPVPPRHTPLADGVLDRAWFAGWVAAGLRDLDRYLAKHAAFDAYCRRLDGTV
jgi:hypothetical protein